MKKTILFAMLLIFSLTACSTAQTTPEQTAGPLATEFVAEPTQTSVPSEDPPVQVEATDVPVMASPTTGVEATQEPTPTQESAPVQSFEIVSGESSVSYEVGEVFIREGNVVNTAIGVTDVMSGVIEIDPSNPQNSVIGPISVDISKFTSDQNLRDKAIRERWLESEKYPIAKFVPTNIEGIPATGEESKDYALKITGDMTIREVTKEVTFDATVKVENNVLSGTASTVLLMSDFGFGPIDIIGILKTEDEVKLTMNLVARTGTDQQ